MRNIFYNLKKRKQDMVKKNILLSCMMLISISVFAGCTQAKSTNTEPTETTTTAAITEKVTTQEESTGEAEAEWVVTIEEFAFEAVILEVKDGEMLVKVSETTDVFTQDTEVSVYYDMGEFKADQKIRITFNGTIYETEPPKIAATILEFLE